MSKPYNRNSPFGPENWTDIYMARNYVRYMDSGNKPGCGLFLLGVVQVFGGFFVFFFIIYMIFFWSSDSHTSLAKPNMTGRIKSYNGLNVRSEANSKAVVLGTVPFNETVSIIDTNGRSDTISGQAANWIKIEYNGTTGWIWGGLVEQ